MSSIKTTSSSLTEVEVSACRRGEQKANKTKTTPTNTLTDYEQIKHYCIIDNILFVVLEFIGTV